MNHDIAHCDNEDCPAKNNCKRYIAHTEAVKLKLNNISYLYNEPDIRKDDGSCIAFWETN